MSFAATPISRGRSARDPRNPVFGYGLQIAESRSGCILDGAKKDGHSRFAKISAAICREASSSFVSSIASANDFKQHDTRGCRRHRRLRGSVQAAALRPAGGREPLHVLGDRHVVEVGDAHHRLVRLRRRSGHDIPGDFEVLPPHLGGRRRTDLQRHPSERLVAGEHEIVLDRGRARVRQCAEAATPEVIISHRDERDDIVRSVRFDVDQRPAARVRPSTTSMVATASGEGRLFVEGNQGHGLVFVQGNPDHGLLSVEKTDDPSPHRAPRDHRRYRDGMIP